MRRREFTNCLNLEPKAFNFPVKGIIGAVLMLVLLGVSKGLMWGLGGAVFGFSIGSWVSKLWHSGHIQRQIYWHLPWGKLLIDRNIPESHYRRLI